MGTACSKSFYGDEDSDNVKVIGDYLNPQTQILIYILDFCNCQPKIELIDLRSEKVDEQSRVKTSSIVNPTDSYPLLIHKRMKIVGQIDAMMNYLKNVFPIIDQELF